MDIHYVHHDDPYICINGLDLSGVAIGSTFRLPDTATIASFESGSTPAKFCKIEVCSSAAFFDLGDYISAPFVQGDGWAKFKLWPRPVPSDAIIGINRKSAMRYAAAITTLKLSGCRIGDASRTHIAMRLKPAIG